MDRLSQPTVGGMRKVNRTNCVFLFLSSLLCCSASLKHGIEVSRWSTRCCACVCACKPVCACRCSCMHVCVCVGRWVIIILTWQTIPSSLKSTLKRAHYQHNFTVTNNLIRCLHTHFPPPRRNICAQIPHTVCVYIHITETTRYLPNSKENLPYKPKWSFKKHRNKHEIHLKCRYFIKDPSMHHSMSGTIWFVVLIKLLISQHICYCIFNISR